MGNVLIFANRPGGTTFECANGPGKGTSTRSTKNARCKCLNRFGEARQTGAALSGFGVRRPETDTGCCGDRQAVPDGRERRGEPEKRNTHECYGNTKKTLPSEL